MYRFQKFARKHKPALATAAAIALCLLLGTTVSAWQAVRATTAEAQAQANEQKAVTSAAAAEQKEQEAIQQRDEVKALADKLAAKDQQLQRTLYAAHMNLARHAWTEAALPRLHELLEQHRPKADQNDLRGFEWHYLNRLSHAELMKLEGDIKWVLSVACSPDGTLVAATCSDRSVRIWDTKSGRQLRSLTGHTNQVNRVVFSPDGKRLASASGDGTVKVWEVETGKELLSLQGRVGGFGSGHFDDVAFSPDGTRVAGAELSHRVTIWNAQTGEQVLSIPDAGRQVAISPDGEQLATDSGHGDEFIKLWNAKTGALIRTIAGEDFVGSIAYSPDGKRLATTLETKQVAIWDVQTGKKLFTLDGHTTTVNCVAFSRDGKKIATGANDRLVKVWDAETGRELFTLKGNSGNVEAVAFFPDGKRLVSGGDHAPIIWDISKAPGPITLGGIVSSHFAAVAISPDGTYVAGGIEDSDSTTSEGKVWDTRTGQELFAITGHKGEVAAVAFSPDGKRLASASLHQQGHPTLGAEIKLWDVKTGRELLNIPFAGLNGQGTDVAFSPDGKRLFACGGVGENFWPTEQGKVKVWDAETGAELMSLSHDKYVGHLALSADGKLLAGGAFFGAGIKIWDLQNNGQEVRQMKGYGPMKFSPDGKRLAAGNKVWDVTTGKKLLELKGHSASISGLAYSTDGKRLATASEDQTVKIWDAETGDELLTLEGHDGDSNGVAFTATGHLLAAGGPDGTIKIYDATPLPEKP